MSNEISFRSREVLNLLNDCIACETFVDNMRKQNGLENAGNRLSIKDIQSVQDKFSVIKNRYERLIPEHLRGLDPSEGALGKDRLVVRIFGIVALKVDQFFKTYTVLVKVECDARWGNKLFLHGLNGNWQEGHELTLKNTCDWSIRIPKPSGINYVEFKVVRKPANSNTLEWQPGQNLFIFSDDQEFKVTVNGSFSESNSWEVSGTRIEQPVRSSSRSNDISNNREQPQKRRSLPIQIWNYSNNNNSPVDRIPVTNISNSNNNNEYPSSPVLRRQNNASQEFLPPVFGGGEYNNAVDQEIEGPMREFSEWEEREDVSEWEEGEDVSEWEEREDVSNICNYSNNNNSPVDRIPVTNINNSNNNNEYPSSPVLRRQNNASQEFLPPVFGEGEYNNAVEQEIKGLMREFREWEEREDVSNTGKAVPDDLRLYCSISRDVMIVPVFPVSGSEPHRLSIKDENFTARHYVDWGSFQDWELSSGEGGQVKCVLCNAIISRNDLRTDTQLQGRILAFMKEVLNK